MHAIGIDIGGTKIAAALVDELGTIIRSDRRPTTASDPRGIEDAVVEMITGLADGEEVVGTSIAKSTPTTRWTRPS